MPDGEERSLGLWLALIGAGSALLGSVIGVLGSVAVADQQADREDENRLRDRREALYVRLLDYERRNLYREHEAVLTQAVERLDALAEGKPLPSAGPAPEVPKDLAEARRITRHVSTASLEQRKLFAEVEVYASPEVRGLFVEFFQAQRLEVEALWEAARREDDDDTEADRRRQEARQRQDVANAALAEQVRREVADA